jgi:hypothetical protein
MGSRSSEKFFVVSRRLDRQGRAGSFGKAVKINRIEPHSREKRRCGSFKFAVYSILSNVEEFERIAGKREIKRDKAIYQQKSAIFDLL